MYLRKLDDTILMYPITTQQNMLMINLELTTSAPNNLEERINGGFLVIRR